MQHGYTNLTEQVAEGVRKTFAGPDSASRSDAELAALTRLRDVLPVPPVVAQGPDGSLVLGLVEGRHGQELLDAGHDEAVLSACGTLLRRVHDLDPGVLRAGPHAAGTVVRHGDFGPNNVLLDPVDLRVTALLDWEFSGVGPPVDDIAWCEWIVRMHHPGSVGALEAFFDAYGSRPPWAERQAAMVRRCRALESFCHRWEPAGRAAATWRRREEITRAWTV